MQQKLYREELLQIFPQKLRQSIENSVIFENLIEIRLRAELPVSIVTTEENYFLKKEEDRKRKEIIKKRTTDMKLRHRSSKKKVLEKSEISRN